MQKRLQKIIADAGIASRRTAEKFIRDGRVSVNDCVINQLGVKADVNKDEIRIDGELISKEIPKTYLKLNKPRGYITSLKDPRGRPIIFDLLQGLSKRVFPVGRLDYDSEGLLLLTNNGSLAHKLQHPKFAILKTYMVKIKGNLTREEVRAIKNGVELDDGIFVPSNIELDKINSKSCWLKLAISGGKNRIIRRVFESIACPVIRLIRVRISDIHLNDLGTGDYKYLTEREIKKLLSL